MVPPIPPTTESARSTGAGPSPRRRTTPPIRRARRAHGDPSVAQSQSFRLPARPVPTRLPAGAPARDGGNGTLRPSLPVLVTRATATDRPARTTSAVNVTSASTGAGRKKLMRMDAVYMGASGLLRAAAPTRSTAQAWMPPCMTPSLLARPGSRVRRGARPRRGPRTARRSASVRTRRRPESSRVRTRDARHSCCDRRCRRRSCPTRSRWRAASRRRPEVRSKRYRRRR